MKVAPFRIKAGLEEPSQGKSVLLIQSENMFGLSAL